MPPRSESRCGRVAAGREVDGGKEEDAGQPLSARTPSLVAASPARSKSSSGYVAPRDGGLFLAQAETTTPDAGLSSSSSSSGQTWEDGSPNVSENELSFGSEAGGSGGWSGSECSDIEVAGTDVEQDGLACDPRSAPKATTKQRDNCEFDDAAHAEACNTEEEHFKSVDMADVMTNGMFSFPDLCDAQHSMNTEAATSAFEPITAGMACCQDEVWRTCLLVLVNVVAVCGVLPHHMRVSPVVPVTKPAKDNTEFDNYRQISLLSSCTKLIDRMLFLRLRPALLRAMAPWQGGGFFGADEFAWLLSRVVGQRKRTWSAFLDAEAAFCRPPRACILNSLWEM